MGCFFFFPISDKLFGIVLQHLNVQIQILDLDEEPLLEVYIFLVFNFSSPVGTFFHYFRLCQSIFSFNISVLYALT